MAPSQLRFRNVDVAVDAPVDEWPIEALATSLERGELADWRRLAGAIEADPWGPVARRIEYVLSYNRPYGTGELFDGVIRRARARADTADRAEVARRLRDLLACSALSRRDFAERLGTSASRLSTYLSGSVTPSAALLVRAERIARSASAQ